MSTLNDLAALPPAAKFVVGIDAATATGICRGYPGAAPQMLSVDFSAPTPEGQFAKALDWALGYFTPLAATPIFVYIEEPLPIAVVAKSGHSSASAIKVLNGLYAIISAACVYNNIPITAVSPSRARSLFIGANYERSEAKRRALGICDILGWGAKDDDQADAAAIWHYGCWIEAPRQATIITPGMHARAPAMRPRKPPLPRSRQGSGVFLGTFKSKRLGKLW